MSLNYSSQYFSIVYLMDRRFRISILIGQESRTTHGCHCSATPDLLAESRMKN